MIFYDWLLNSAKPDPSEYGGRPLVMVAEYYGTRPYNGATAFWGPNPGGPNAPPFGETTAATNPCPDQAACDAALAGYENYTGLILLDCESWQSHGGTQVGAEASRDKYIQLITQCRITCPLAQFGFYNVLPLVTNPGFYNASQGVGNVAGLRQYQDWFLPLAGHVDVICPTWYFNRSTGVITGTSLKVLRRTNDFVFEEIARCYPNMPVYPFIDPFYINTFASGREVSAAVWRQVLEELEERGCEGAVLWGGSGVGVPFDVTDPWYLETLKFQASRGLVRYSGVA